MTAPLTDPSLARAASQQDDLVARKRSLDALRQRVGAQPDKAKKLREACEGFESVFLQKVWEQMRTTVPKEGYLHSREEQFWQSMFDQELAKKMSSAGGIGLADMLYDQLSSTLLSASRRSAAQGTHDAVPVDPVSALPERGAGQTASVVSGGDATAGAAKPGEASAAAGASAPLYAPLSDAAHGQPTSAAEGAMGGMTTGQPAPPVPSASSASSPASSANAADAGHASPVAAAGEASTPAVPLSPDQQAVLQRELAAYARQVAAQRSAAPAAGTTGTEQVATGAAVAAAGPTAASGPESATTSPAATIPPAGHDAARAARSAGADFMPPPPVVRSPRNGRPDIPTTYRRNAGRRTDTASPAVTGPRVPSGQPVTRRPGMTPAEGAQAVQNAASTFAPSAAAAQGVPAPSAPQPPTLPGVPAYTPGVPGMVTPPQGATQPVPPVASPPSSPAGAPVGMPATRLASPVGGPAPAPLPGRLAWPVAGHISEGFGWRSDPVTGERAWHPGVDLAAAEGSPVRACWDGKVVFAGEQGDYGNLVVVEHAGGWRSYYGHNAALSVRAGDVVASGSELAKAGATGRANGPHVHFEVRLGELALNPETLAGKGNAPSAS
ncbi:MAG TPA: peptidase M24 [Desulfovibrio sp.]|nr:peptidase M24 [Desulfovibrio sp.]